MAAIQKPWEFIANYESHELVRARYQAKHGRQPNAAHAREIATRFIQARHYYSAAVTADRTIKPLLPYYGLISLSRGLVLFLTPGLREAALAQSHGLSVQDWQSVLSAPNPDIGNLQIVVSSAGTFVEFIRAINNRNLLRGKSSAVNTTSELGSVPANTVLTLGALLARLPDVLGQFCRWQTPRCVRISRDKIAGSVESNLVVQRNAPYISEDVVMDIVGRDHCELVSVDAERIVVRTRQGGVVAGFLTDLFSSSYLGIGELLMAQPYSSGIRLAKGPQLFAISYVLSMLVRYHPSLWMNLVHQRINDAALPTIFRVIDCLETLFPQIAVDFLEE